MHTDRVSIRQGGGLLSLFGLPFLGFGLFACAGVLSAAGLLPALPENTPAAVGFGLIPFAMMFTAVGGGLVFGRTGVIVDGRARRVTRWWGLLVPFARKESSLDDHELVVIVKEVRRSKNGSYTVFPVKLEGGDGLTVISPRDHGTARREAERVAKAAGLGIEDRTTDPWSRRAAGSLDVSLRDRLRAEEGEEPPAPVPPTSSRLTYGAGGRTRAVVEIPSAGLGCQALGAGLGFVAVPLFLFVFLCGFGPLDLPEQVALPVTAGVVLLVGGFGVYVAAAISSNERIIVDLDGVIVERESFLRTWREELSMDELEAVEVASRSSGALDQRVLALESDRKTVDVGRALSLDEKRWLRDLIRYVARTGRAA